MMNGLGPWTDMDKDGNGEVLGTRDSIQSRISGTRVPGGPSGWSTSLVGRDDRLTGDGCRLSLTLSTEQTLTFGNRFSVISSSRVVRLSVQVCQTDQRIHPRSHSFPRAARSDEKLISMLDRFWRQIIE